MGKRVANSGNATAAKKVKVNPVFAEIQDSLKHAEHLPENCRAMLSAMVPGMFSSACEQRSEHQSTVIQWVEDAMLKQKAKLVGETDVVRTKLADQGASKAARAGEAQKAEENLAELRKVVASKKTALAEVTIAMKATEKMLAEKQEEQRTLDSEYLAMKKEQEGLAAAFVEHFQVPMNAGEALHYESLQPFLRNLDLEESFMISVPSSCAKTKDQRGSFDNVVLESLQQALLDRAAQIKDVVSNRSPESEAREVAVQQAEEQLAANKSDQEKAAAELASAQRNVEAGAISLKEAEKVVEFCDVEVRSTSEVCEKLQSHQDAFEQGPLSSFLKSKDGTAHELCAAAGA